MFNAVAHQQQVTIKSIEFTFYFERLKLQILKLIDNSKWNIEISE